VFKELDDINHGLSKDTLSMIEDRHPVRQEVQPDDKQGSHNQMGDPFY
jgi:hypothetical protein